MQKLEGRKLQPVKPHSAERSLWSFGPIRPINESPAQTLRSNSPDGEDWALQLNVCFAALEVEAESLQAGQLIKPPQQLMLFNYE